MTLIYCNYSVLNQVEEPAWVGILAYLKTNTELTKFNLYRPLFPLNPQMVPEDPVADSKIERLKLILKLTKFDGYQETFDHFEEEGGPSIDYLVGAEEQGGGSHLHILKDLWMLAKSDIVVTDCDYPDHGTKDMILLLARMLDIKTIGVCNRFLTSPWLHASCDYMTKTLELADLISVLTARSPENPKEETNNEKH